MFLLLHSLTGATHLTALVVVLGRVRCDAPEQLQIPIKIDQLTDYYFQLGTQKEK
jgi:hypothetical protein